MQTGKANDESGNMHFTAVLIFLKSIHFYFASLSGHDVHLLLVHIFCYKPNVLHMTHYTKSNYFFFFCVKYLSDQEMIQVIMI